MEEDDGMLSPLWLQAGHQRHRLRRANSMLLNSSALIVVFLVTALSFIFIILPTLHSFISHIFNPQLVKKGWDLLNVALVLFAIICGILGRNYNENGSSYDSPNTPNTSQSQETTIKSNPSTPHSWYEYSDRMAYNRINRLRSINSYPDLRQESPWIDDDEGWRFYDDTHISFYRTKSQHLYERQPRQETNEELGIKDIAEDTSIAPPEEPTSATSQPTAAPSPPLPPTPPSSPPPTPTPKVMRRKTKRTYQAIGKNEETEIQEKNELEVKGFQPSPPLPLAPLQPAPVTEHVKERSGQSNKKRGTATKEFLNTLRRNRKKQRQKSIENFEALLSSQSSSLALEKSQRTEPPPPPPLPPQHSVFHGLFASKKGKQKKRHSSPPPNVLRQRPQKSTRSKPKSSPHVEAEASTSYTTALPARSIILTGIEESIKRGNESPLISIPPPPPPPPPFKVRNWRFAVHGDFVRVNSTESSRSSSPDLDYDGEDSPSNRTSQIIEQGREPPLFCSSPDVDTKANRFIANFRAGLKLEKMNSMKRRRGKSKLGQSQILNPVTQETDPS